jgi:hypothetical protein
VVITTQNEKSALSVKRHLSSHLPDCINKRGQRLICSSERKFEAALGEEGRERERHILERGISVLFGLSLDIVLAIYIKEVFVGFSPS